MTQRQNVLFITVDQWRGDCLGVAGHPLVQTPTLDRLSNEGVRFANHYSQCAPCGPSRASIHTGTYLHTHRSVYNGTPLEDRFTNMARHFRAGGYDPTLFGYTDTTLDPATLTPDDPRLCTYEEVLPGYTVGTYPGETAGDWLNWLESKGVDVTGGQWEVRSSQSGYPGSDGRGSTFPPPRFSAEQTEAAFLVERIIEHANNSDDGWFVHGSFLSPHPPFAVPEPYNSMFDPADVEKPKRASSVQEEGKIHPFVELALSFLSSPSDELEQRQTQATYYAMMAEVDAQIDRLLASLDSSGNLENTTVIITSDHGEQMGDHWLTEKLGFYDQSFHIPLIVWRKGGFDAPTVEAFTENVDLFPTISEIAGLEIPVQCQGNSLVPFLSGATPDGWRTEVHWEFDFRGVVGGQTGAKGLGLSLEQCCLAVVRDERGKYVHFPGLPPVYFDLVEDPHEMVNLANDPTRSTDVLSYAQRLIDWQLTSVDQSYANLLASPMGNLDLRKL